MRADLILGNDFTTRNLLVNKTFHGLGVTIRTDLFIIPLLCLDIQSQDRGGLYGEKLKRHNRAMSQGAETLKEIPSVVRAGCPSSNDLIFKVSEGKITPIQSHPKI